MKPPTRDEIMEAITNYCRILTSDISSKDEKLEWFTSTFDIRWRDLSSMNEDELDGFLRAVRIEYDIYQREQKRQKPRCAGDCRFRLDDETLYR